jgi:hypothetical protein
VGVPATEYGAAALIVVVALLALIPREIRQGRADHFLPRPGSGEPEPAVLGSGVPAVLAAASGSGPAT